MGEAAVQSQLNQIERTRSELDRTIDELFAVLPPKEELVAQAKQLAAASAAAITAVVVGTSVLRSRAEEKAKAKEARRNADALVAAFRAPPEPDEDGTSTAAWFAVGAGLAAVGVAVWNRFGEQGQRVV